MTRINIIGKVAYYSGLSIILGLPLQKAEASLMLAKEQSGRPDHLILITHQQIERVINKFENIVRITLNIRLSNQQKITEMQGIVPLTNDEARALRDVILTLIIRVNNETITADQAASIIKGTSQVPGNLRLDLQNGITTAIIVMNSKFSDIEEGSLASIFHHRGN